jgi:pyridoxamine 5'-phosphate oxidase family protein
MADRRHGSVPAFTSAEVEYLRGQRLGRLATIDREGVPQNNPVGFTIDPDSGVVLIGGTALGASRKFRNVEQHAGVAFVVDDLASVDPWVVRGVEFRGSAEALTDVDPPMPGMSREVIRITPAWIFSWGLDDSPDHGRTV